MRGRWELSDDQWQVIEPVLPPKRRSDGRGRPWQDPRGVLNGILWVLGQGPAARAAQEISAVPDLTSPPAAVVPEGKLEDFLRVLAERYGIEMITHHRGERREPTEDGRPLRRYRRRWRVERLFA